MSVVINIDQDLKNADWVKKSDDKLSFLNSKRPAARDESRECGADDEGEEPQSEKGRIY